MAKFWTDKTFLPYQKHKFKVQLELWYIQGFDQGQAAIDTQSIISKNKIHRVDIPPHFIRSVDLPKFSTSIENTAGTFSPSSNIQAEAGDFEDLTITFYMVDDLVSLIPSIFYAYYLDFGTGNSAPVPLILNLCQLRRFQLPCSTRHLTGWLNTPMCSPFLMILATLITATPPLLSPP